mgnify:CR=1 FL=1
MSRILNYDRIYSKVLSDPAVQRYAKEVAERKMAQFKKEMIEEFEKDEITRELRNPAGGNISNTLDGKDNKSLFGFIGFEAGSNPVQKVREQLEQTHLEQEGISKGNLVKQIRFKIKYPSFKEIAAENPLPFEGGRSWIYGIEKGISGFGSFLAGFFKDKGFSRSGQGIQLKEEDGSPLVIRTGSFKPRRYISRILENFRNKWLQLK